MSVSWTDDTGVTDDPDRFEQAITAFRRRVPMTEKEWEELTSEERQRAFKVANVAQADLIQDVFDALDSAITNGGTFEDFQAEIGDQLAEAWGSEEPWHVESIFRTNVMSAYVQGAHEIISTPEAKEARPYWRQDVIDDDRLCDICEPLADVVLPADDPYWATHISPFHISCRCPPPTPMTDAEAAEEGVTDEPPEAEASDGFGAAPATDDWEPDPSRFDEHIAAELERKLG